MVGENIGFCNTQAVAQDIQKFALNPPNVSGTKDTSADCPMVVFQGGVIGELVSQNDSTEEHTLVSPLLHTDVELRLCAIDVYKGNKYDGKVDFCAVKYSCDEFEESVSGR